MIRSLLILIVAVFAVALPAAAQGTKSDKPYFAAKEVYQLFVIGDSLAAGLWSGVSRQIETDDRISLNGRYKEDSGLSRPEYYDWNGALPKILASNKIDIAIVMIGSNDAQAMRDGSMRYAFDTPEWRQSYVKQVDRLMASLKAAGAAVYWMEMPPMQAAKYDGSMKVISAIHEERAKAAGIRFIATRNVLSDKGKYAESGFDPAGEFVRMRSRDGVHFLREGNNKLAGLVMAAINADIDTAVAAEPAEPTQPPPETAVNETPPGSGLTGAEILAHAKGDFAGPLPTPTDPAMAQLAKTTKAGTDAARLFSRGEAVTAKPGRFDDVSAAQ
jgi:hypothetical protein